MKSGGITPQFLTSALNGGKWSDSRSCRLTPGETATGTRCLGGSVGSRASLDVTENINESYPYRESNPDFSVVLPVA
jgi:hypothetical protein